MARGGDDIALWLHNKLGSTDDLWSGSSICSQLTHDKLLNIQESFHQLQPHVKVKLMLSFLHLSKRNVEEWQSALENIISIARDDTDQWVVMVADMLQQFPTSGTISHQVAAQHHFFQQVLSDLKKIVKKSSDAGMLPLECSYLSRSAMATVAGQQPSAVKHFALKRKPKSAALRAEILQKSNDAMNNQKKNPGAAIPVKSRSFAKNMDDPLPGKAGRSPSGSTAGFLRANSSSGSRFTGNAARSNALRREGGVKLLDISEMPVGAKEAKRRKKLAEQEAAEQQKKEKEAVVTPDYAAGLISPAVSTLGTPTVSTSLYVTTSRLTNVTTGVTTIITTTGGNIQSVTQPAKDNSQQPQIVAISTPTSTQPSANPVQIVPGPGTTTVEGQQNQPKKGLTLTREQMVEAQEMFRVSNKVTRPEKALILGFMAGSRENPCPQQGDIVNIRLSETQDSIQQPDGLFKPMMVDVYFQMNYASGEWKRIRKYREIEPE